MNYPLISEYVEAIKLAEDNFEELSYLRPVLGDDGLPVMTSGNFAVVFKMKDEQSGKYYAVKCFTKEQEGRTEAYREITKELKDVSSPYLVSIRYLENELFVDTSQTTETEFPVLLMDWVEGKTLDKYLRENLDDKYALEMLAYRFSQLAQWLIPQSFAHGDLKPDNILVREDGTLVLVDYDGMYVPAMKGQKARELGSPDFRHPQRTENDFSGRIDDFSLTSILLSLKAISLKPHLFKKFGDSNRLLFSEKDYRNFDNCETIIKEVWPSFDNELNMCYRDFWPYLYNWPYSYEQFYYHYIWNLKFEIPYISNNVTSITNEEWLDRISEGNKYGCKEYSNDKKKLFRFSDIGFINNGEYLSPFNHGTGSLVYFSQCVIQDKIQVICDMAFNGCKIVNHVFIPSSVKYIGEKAFKECKFRYIELPDNLIYINKNAFEGCIHLEEIIIPCGSILKYSKLLPYNVNQLREVNREKVKSLIHSFLGKSKMKGTNYWEAMASFFDNKGGAQLDYRREDKTGIVKLFDVDYHIDDIESVDEITNAIYYILIYLRGAEILENICYM